MKVWQLVAALIAALAGSVIAQNPMVNVIEGELMGKTVRFSEQRYINVTTDVDVYLGVPYADPPARFKPPLPSSGWTGERNATAFKPACKQSPSFYFPNQDEDCLYLNVYVPNPKPSGAAVMVWIHGGGLTSGTSMVYDYYGVPLVAVGGDIIVVTINYRLGVFAKFTTKDAEAPGNIGMLDQVAALRWIKANIKAFGGNENKITIFGESAGAASVSFHLLSKLSRSLFNQAIMQSGSAFSPWAFEDNPQKELEASRKIGELLGCDTSSSTSLVQCLQTKDALTLWSTAHQVYEGAYPVTVDGTFLEQTPRELYANDGVTHVPIMAGFNKDEGTLYLYSSYLHYAGSKSHPPLNRSEFERFLTGYLGRSDLGDDAILNAVFNEYIDWTFADNSTAEFFPSAVNAAGDLFLTCPTEAVIRAHALFGDRVYKYYFAHEVQSTSFYHVVDVLPFTPWLGAGHAEDLLYVWGMPFIDQLFNVHGHNMTEGENALSVQFMKFWTNFAKTGNPNKPSDETSPINEPDVWPEFTVPGLQHKILDIKPTEGRAIKARECHFWNDYIPQLVRALGNFDTDERKWRNSFNDWKIAFANWREKWEGYQSGKSCQ